MDPRSGNTADGVVVLRRTYGQARVAMIVVALTAAGSGLFTLAAFADSSTWLEYPFLALTIGAAFAMLQLRKRAYLISGDAVAERSGVILGGSATVRLEDVVAVTWHRSVRPSRAPRGCVLWATDGGHRQRPAMWPINQIVTTEVRAVKSQLETQHGKLGALLIDYAALSPDSGAAFIDLLRHHRFSPLPTGPRVDQPMVSYPPA